MAGVLALVGGDEWQDGCSFDRGLLESSGGDEVLVLATALAFEGPAAAVERARIHFDNLGAKVRELPVLDRTAALDEANVDDVRHARFIYLSGGSSMHLRAVLKDSPVWEALLEAWRGGSVVAASEGSGTMVCDPSIDPRGGAFTVGLGLIEGMAFVPRRFDWSHDRRQRTMALAPKGIPVLAVDEQTAAIRGVDGVWRIEGAGEGEVIVDGRAVGLDVLP